MMTAPDLPKLARWDGCAGTGEPWNYTFLMATEMRDELLAYAKEGDEAWATEVQYRRDAEARIAELEQKVEWYARLAIEHGELYEKYEKAEARCKELAEEAGDRIGALNQVEAELAALWESHSKYHPSCEDCGDSVEAERSTE